jgi:hypothetical protein
MPALPPESTALAAARWLSLLCSLTPERTWAVLAAEPRYADLTRSQYWEGLEWLHQLGMLKADGSLITQLRELSQPRLAEVVFARGLERSRPAWLPDADILIGDTSDLPYDAVLLGNALGLAGLRMHDAVQAVHGRIDHELRSSIGLAGELALIDVLEAALPGSTTHIAATDDGFGYDVLFRSSEVERHFEVKTTTRKGRLVVHLSRHEFRVGLIDPAWRLVIVGLDPDETVGALATVRASRLVERAPTDTHANTSWESARYELSTDDLVPGLDIGSDDFTSDSLAQGLVDCGSTGSCDFAWMPA